ncbi:MAG: hypothetical protein VB858_14650, partial [Planctomycetaceae bacterium]
MWKQAVAVLLTVLACPIVFTSLEAGVFCGHPAGNCACSPCLNSRPQPCRCSESSPVGCRTHVQPVPQITYRDVTSTRYHLQPESQRVPVTRYRNVTVDQGAWHKIWVPEFVTRQVPETVYEHRISYRQVPYQVTQRVPEATFSAASRYVPALSARPATAGIPRRGSGTTWSSQPVIATQPVTPRTVTVDPVPPDLRPLRRISAVPDRQASSNTSQADAEGWTRVTTRSGSPQSTPHRVSSASGRFIPASRTASVLRT